MSKSGTLATLAAARAGLLLSDIRDTNASVAGTSVPDNGVTSNVSETADSDSASATITIRTYAVADEDANQGI